MLEIDIHQRFSEFDVQAELRADRGITVLFGPSGAGKSVTLRCVAGLIRPDSGRIVIGERVLFDSHSQIDLPPQKRRVGYVPQDYALFPHLTVAGNVAFGLEHWPRARLRSAVAETLALVNLAEYGNRRPAGLSGGQQQRVALARALVRRPDVLLLDEPFAALDAPVRAELRQQIRELQRRFDIPTLFITHDLSEASFVGDQIAIFCRGRVHQVGTPTEVLMRPADLQVAQAVGVKNILTGRVVERSDAGLAVMSGQSLFRTPPYPFHVGDQVLLCIRPERVMLRQEGRLVSQNANQFSGTITGETSDGLNCTLALWSEQGIESLSGPGRLYVDLPVYVYERLNIPEQRHWVYSIPAGAIHVIAAA